METTSKQTIRNDPHQHVCLILGRQAASFRVERDHDLNHAHVWEKEKLHLIKEYKIHKVLDQVCARLESCLHNPNDSNSRNELGNAIRLLAARIDHYNQMTSNMSFNDITLDLNLLHIQSDCQAIIDWINEVKDEQQLSEEGIATFKEIAEDFLNENRQFCSKLLKATDELEYMSDFELYNGFERLKEKFRRFKEFFVNNWWWIPKAAIYEAVTGAATGGLSRGYVGGWMPYSIAVGAAIGFIKGAATGAVSGTTSLLTGAAKFAIGNKALKH